MTHAGMILGTAAYMSPEQAKGRSADRASDVWALGCVLFEMLSGTRAFKGEEISEVLASVLRDEPDWATLPNNTPASVLQVLRLCLQKDRQRRLRDMSAIRLALDGAFDGLAGPKSQTVDDKRSSSRWRQSALVGVAALLVGGAGVWLLRPSPPGPTAAPLIRFSISPPAGFRLRAVGKLLAISPDGMRIAYRSAPVSDLNGGTLNIQALDAFDPVQLPGRVRSGPVFSPDGRTVAFYDGLVLRSQPIDGGAVVTICPLDGDIRGLSWATDDTIVFATVRTRGLMRVPATGGTPTRLTTAGDASGANHFWPSVLPNGRGIVFTKWSGVLDRAQLAVLSLATNEVVDLVPGTSPVYSDSGHLIFGGRDRSLRAIAFDQETLHVTGEPTTVLDRVGIEVDGSANFGLSSTGTLVYTTESTNVPPSRTIVWVDRNGREEPTGAPPRAFTYARLSPDGTRVALDARDEPPDVWIWELARKTLQRLTNDPGLNRLPTWAPDGKRVAFTVDRDGIESVYWQVFDGSGEVERLSDGIRRESPASFAPDGSGILTIIPQTPPYDVGLISIGPPRSSKLLLQTPASESNAEISPDGRWMAYESDESGRAEIWVRPFPALNTSRRQVSTTGGTRPLWSRKGDELFFFVAPDTIMAAPVGLGTDLTLLAPRAVLKWPHAIPVNTGRHYDVSADGKRFLVLKDVDGQQSLSSEIRVVERWGDELKAKLSKR
ncbi:MAG: protein kinase [Vicinamibacterales bacterium]